MTTGQYMKEGQDRVMVCGGCKSNAIRNCCDDNLMRKNVKKIFFYRGLFLRELFLEKFHSRFYVQILFAILEKN